MNTNFDIGRYLEMCRTGNRNSEFVKQVEQFWDDYDPSGKKGRKRHKALIKLKRGSVKKSRRRF